MITADAVMVDVFEAYSDVHGGWVYCVLYETADSTQFVHYYLRGW